METSVQVGTNLDKWEQVGTNLDKWGQSGDKWKQVGTGGRTSGPIRCIEQHQKT